MQTSSMVTYSWRWASHKQKQHMTFNYCFLYRVFPLCNVCLGLILKIEGFAKVQWSEVRNLLQFQRLFLDVIILRPNIVIITTITMGITITGPRQKLFITMAEKTIWTPYLTWLEVQKVSRRLYKAYKQNTFPTLLSNTNVEEQTKFLSSSIPIKWITYVTDKIANFSQLSRNHAERNEFSHEISLHLQGIRSR